MIDGSAARDEDWRAISREMAASPVVFVAGVPRSGTTALRATLDRHPAFRARVDESPETKVFSDPARLRDLAKDGPDGARLREYLLGDEGELAALRAHLDAIPWRDGLRRATGPLAAVRHEGLRAAAWRLRGDHHRLRLFFHHAQRARGVRRVLEKTPAHLRRLPEMLLTFPRLQAILCIRHPVEVYSSYRKKLFKAEQRGGADDRHRWLRISLDRFCQRYREWTDIVLSEPERRPDRVARVRYEDLTQDPKAELARLCDFLGEPFDEAAMFDELDVRRDDFGSPRPGSRIVANEKDWTEFLPREEAVQVEERTAEEMRRLSYRPVASAGGAGW